MRGTGKRFEMYTHCGHVRKWKNEVNLQNCEERRSALAGFSGKAQMRRSENVFESRKKIDAYTLGRYNKKNVFTCLRWRGREQKENNRRE